MNLYSKIKSNLNEDSDTELEILDTQIDFPAAFDSFDTSGIIDMIKDTDSKDLSACLAGRTKSVGLNTYTLDIQKCILCGKVGYDDYVPTRQNKYYGYWSWEDNYGWPFSNVHFPCERVCKIIVKIPHKQCKTIYIRARICFCEDCYEKKVIPLAREKADEIKKIIDYYRDNNQYPSKGEVIIFGNDILDIINNLIGGKDGINYLGVDKRDKNEILNKIYNLIDYEQPYRSINEVYENLAKYFGAGNADDSIKFNPKK